MKNINKVIRNNGKATLISSVLILAGSTLSAQGIQVHISVEKSRPDMAFVNSKYMINNHYSGHLSELRKSEIMARIGSIRKQIRAQAESYRIDKYTTISGVTATQKSVVHCTRLMNEISQVKG